MQDLHLTVTKRAVFGKRNKALRRRGYTPAHLFGHNLTSQSLEADTAELEKLIELAGMTRLIGLKIDGDKTAKKVFIREVQRDPVSGQLLHVDFYQVRMKEKMTAEIPIVLTGTAPGLRSAGRYLTHPINTITVESFPDRLPPEVIIDLDQLYNLDDAIYVHQIDLGPDVTILTDSEQLVARISEVSAAKIEHELVEEEVESAKEAVEEAAEEPTPGIAEAVTEEKPEI